MENNQNVPTEEVKVETNNTQPKKDNKIYKILSYIGILWLIGMLVPDSKDDPEVRFHVGQGMLVTIGVFALNTVIGIIQAIISVILGAIDLYVLSLLASILFIILYGAVNIASLLLMIKGIINANSDKQEPLPVIGKYAFFK